PATFTPEGPIYELFAWIRRAHRSMGLGSRSYETVRSAFARCAEVQPPAGPVYFVTRFPKPAAPGESDPGLALLESVFALYDFRPIRLPQGGKETILVRTIKAAPPMVPGAGNGQGDRRETIP